MADMVERDWQFPLTLTGRTFSLTPSSLHLDYRCAGSGCSERATHRLLSRATATVEWWCDKHALAWAEAVVRSGQDR